MPDMLFIVLLAVLLFGPKKIPEIARQIARVKSARDNLKAQLESEFVKLEAETREILPAAQELKTAFDPLTKLRQHLDNIITSSVEAEEKPKAQPPETMQRAEPEASKPAQSPAS